ncbi:MAG: helix-turn-helix domain-containing protein, partial [Shewanella sp.]
LAQDIAEGRFREDLFYRLNVIELALPPLNQRIDDILPLVKHFVGAGFSLSKPAQQALLQHRWPGNVRELENACKRAALLAQSRVLTEMDFGLPQALARQLSATNAFAFEQNKYLSSAFERQSHLPAAHAVSPTDTHEAQDVSREDIEAALQQHNGVIARVAKSLGLSRQALYRRMDKFGLEK